MIRLAKHEELYENLKNVLIELEPGDSFISVREIMRRYEVSQATVTSAVEPLLEEGLLEKRSGLGMFVTNEVNKYKASAPPVIALVLPRWMSSVYLQLENAFLNLQSEYGISAELIHYNSNDGMIKELPSRKIDGLIIHPAVDMIKAEEIQLINGFNVPYLILGNMKDLDVNTVNSDDKFGASMAADHLIKLGHQRLAVFNSEPWSNAVADRINGFTEYCSLQGVDVKIFDANIRSGQNPMVLVYDFIKNLCSKDELDFSGMFVISESPCLSVFKALHEHGIRIPDDISVISYGNSCDSDYFYPALTTIESNYTEQLRESINIIKAILSGKERVFPIKHNIRPEIVIRESTGKCIITTQ